MLKKLLKYEFRATARIFLPFYAFLMVFSVINRLFIPLNAEFFNTPRVIAMSVFVFTIAGIFIMTLIVTIQRFYKNLLSDEGYLSFTLPVKTHNHIEAKAIITLLWLVLDIIVCFLAIVIISKDSMKFLQAGLVMMQDVIHETGGPAIIIGIQLVVLAILSVLSNLFKMYAAISVGNLVNKHKTLLGLGTYIGFDIVENTVFSLLVFGMGHMTIFNSSFNIQMDSFNGSFQMDPSYLGIPMGLLLFMSTLYLISGFIYFFITNKLLNNNLNLE